ncbi:MAG: hypothetical protein Q9219_005395 [cf. Caloplaca sp. 3 TL-2023]
MKITAELPQAARRVLLLTGSIPTPLVAPAISEPINREAIPEALSLIKAEFALTLEEKGSPQDGYVLGKFYTAKYQYSKKQIQKHEFGPRIGQVMEILRFRFRVQESIFLLAELLMEKQLVDPATLHQGIHWDWQPSSWEMRASWLEAWSVARTCLGLESRGCGRFPSAITWLCSLIERSGSDEVKLASLLQSSRLLGSFDENKFADRLTPEGIGIWDQDQKAESIQHLPQVGFWLPYDLKTPGVQGLSEHFAKLLPRYMRVRTTYEKCFGPGSWGDDSLFRDTMDWYTQ